MWHNNTRIKSFEVKNNFPHLLFCQRRPFLDNLAGFFPLKIQTKQRKWKFSRESLRWKCSFGRKQSIFDHRSGENLVEKWQTFLSSFRKKCVLVFLKKKFYLQMSLGHVECITDNALEKFSQKLKKNFTQSPVTIEKQKLSPKVSCWILSLNA